MEKVRVIVIPSPNYICSMLLHVWEKTGRIISLMPDGTLEKDICPCCMTDGDRLAISQTLMEATDVELLIWPGVSNSSHTSDNITVAYKEYFPEIKLECIEPGEKKIFKVLRR